MPRSTRPAAYGPEYEHFLLTFKAQGRVTIPLPSPGHAATFRGKLYAYFKALRKSSQRQDLIAIVDSLSLTIDGCSVCAFPIEDSWDNCALRDALGLKKGAALPTADSAQPSQPTAQDKLLAKLAHIRAKNATGASK
jgi:hypothetical protein